MIPLYDMLAKADEGRAMDLLARQFDISRKQAELAVEALTPAFSQGLKQNAADPYGVGSFLQALASGDHAKYFEDASKAFQPAGVAEGNGILGHLFGSKEVSRAVAAQAAQATGLGQDLLKQMLPVLASMIMGGLFKQSTGQMKGAAGDNPLAEILKQMMGQAAGSRPRAPHPEAPQPGMNKFDIPLGDNPFGKILEGMFGGAAGGGASPSAGDNPFGRIFEEMMGGGGAAKPAAKPQARPAAKKPQANPSGRAKNPYDDLFGNMFDAGAKSRDDYQKGVEQIFDQFRKGLDKHR